MQNQIDLGRKKNEGILIRRKYLKKLFVAKVVYFSLYLIDLITYHTHIHHTELCNVISTVMERDAFLWNRICGQQQKNFRSMQQHKHTSITKDELLGYVFSTCFLCGSCQAYIEEIRRRFVVA
jgi:hypothetical protein